MRSISDWGAKCAISAAAAAAALDADGDAVVDFLVLLDDFDDGAVDADEKRSECAAIWALWFAVTDYWHDWRTCSRTVAHRRFSYW